MIGLDTNFLVRYLAQDDPVQSPKATEIIERRLTEENPGYVSIVAMVETVWVLDRAYRLPAHEIAAAKSLAEIGRIQSEYAQQLAAKTSEQTKEFVDLSTRAAQHLIEKAQAAAKSLHHIS